ncbi:MAG TPA: sulfate permease [Ornithinibacter sp.]|nr:sulfate permease [Ornithinibacter sp.]
MTAPATPPQAPPRTGVLREFVPGIALFRSYQRGWLGKDLVAGLVLSALLVPQGMAYAELAGLPPVTGLYTSILCLVGYAIFGPSRILVLGPDSSLGPMIAATIAPLVLAGGDPDKAVALASVLAVLVGVVMTVAGLGHLGFVADLLSKPTQIGYMNGLALTIVVGQLPKLFGFSVDADGLIEEARAFVTGVADQLVNATGATIGVLSLVGILLMQRLMPKVPAVLVVVVLAALAVNLLDLQADGVKTIGVLPQGFPPFTIPTVAWGDLPELFLGAVAIAVVALADTMSTASSFAARRGERVHGDQEMIGIGAANILAGLFQGFPVSTSGSRTAVSEQAGSRSQVTGIVGAVVIGFVLVFATGVMQYVPQPTLGAIVIAAALSLADLPATRRLWHQRRTEFTLSTAAFLGVALLGVLPGILLAITLSILNVFRRVWWPHQAELGRVEGLSGLHDTGTYPHSELLPGLVVYRFDAPLIFANSRMFGDTVRAMAEERPDLRWVLVAAEPMTDVDTTAADMLAELDSWLNARNVSLAFAEVKDPVRAKIVRYELDRTIDPAHFYPTVDEAVAAYMRETGETWQEPARETREEQR